MHNHHHHCKTPIIIAGVLFSLIALAQLWALATNAVVGVNGSLVPTWAHVIALIIAGLMAIWLFCLCSCCCRCCKDNDPNCWKDNRDRDIRDRDINRDKENNRDRQNKV
jgi:hypothetical protein